MKPTIQSRLGRAIIGVLIPLAGLPSATVRGATADDVRGVEDQQVQLRTQTQRVAAEIDAVILEFQRNGLSEGQDIETLKGVRAILGKLSGEQMQQVIQFLQQARNSGDAAQSRANVVKAVQSQQDVVTNLQALLTTYRHQQEMYQLAAKFSQLADRQESNLGLVIELVQATPGKRLDQFDPTQRDSVSVQQTTQVGIKDDTIAALSSLKTFSAAADGKSAQRLNAAIKVSVDSKITDVQTSAASELLAGNLINSAKLERTSRESLRELARLVTVLEDPATQMKQALGEINRAIEEEKKVGDLAKAAKEDKDKTKTADADKTQAKVIDKTDTTRKNVEEIAPVVSDKLKVAQDKMQETRQALRNNDPDKAADKQKDALDALAKAKTELEKQIQAAETANKDAKDNLEEAADLLKEVQAIHKEQDELKAKSSANTAKADDAGKQAELKTRTDAAQVKAIANTPVAGKALNDASGEMSKAAESMKGIGSPVVAQAAASVDLGKAEEALKKQVEDLEKAKDDLAAVEKAIKDVIELIVKETALSIQTVKAAATKSPAGPLASTQEALAVKTLAVKDAVLPQSAPAASALVDANHNMVQAKAKLDVPEFDAARNSEKEALADLNKAKDLLDQKAAELKDKLGLPDDKDTGALADAIKKAEEANGLRGHDFARQRSVVLIARHS